MTVAFAVTTRRKNKRGAAHKTTEIIEVGDLTETDAYEITELLGSEYQIEVSIEGKAPMLMHRWDSEAVASKAASSKGSKEKKTDNVESYAYRDADGFLAIPARAVMACLAEAARSMQDPRSPRKSLRDLVRAGIRVEPFMIRIQPQSKTWDYIDKQRVVVQRAAITRSRPAIKEGWAINFTVIVLAGEYLNDGIVQDLLHRAGRFVGLMDGRPLYGLFRVTKFKKTQLRA